MVGGGVGGDWPDAFCLLDDGELQCYEDETLAHEIWTIHLHGAIPQEDRPLWQETASFSVPLCFPFSIVERATERRVCLAALTRASRDQWLESLRSAVDNLVATKEGTLQQKVDAVGREKYEDRQALLAGGRLTMYSVPTKLHPTVTRLISIDLRCATVQDTLERDEVDRDDLGILESVKFTIKDTLHHEHRAHRFIVMEQLSGHCWKFLVEDKREWISAIKNAARRPRPLLMAACAVAAGRLTLDAPLERYDPGLTTAAVVGLRRAVLQGKLLQLYDIHRGSLVVAETVRLGSAGVEAEPHCIMIRPQDEDPTEINPFSMDEKRLWLICLQAASVSPDAYKRLSRSTFKEPHQVDRVRFHIDRAVLSSPTVDVTGLVAVVNYHWAAGFGKHTTITSRDRHWSTPPTLCPAPDRCGGVGSGRKRCGGHLEGTLQKKGGGIKGYMHGHVTQERYFILNGTTLTYFRKGRDGQREERGHVDLVGAVVTQEDACALCIRERGTGKVLEAVADTVEQRQEWYDALFFAAAGGRRGSIEDAEETVASVVEFDQTTVVEWSPLGDALLSVVLELRKPVTIPSPKRSGSESPRRRFWKLGFGAKEEEEEEGDEEEEHIVLTTDIVQVPIGSRTVHRSPLQLGDDHDGSSDDSDDEDAEGGEGGRASFAAVPVEMYFDLQAKGVPIGQLYVQLESLLPRQVSTLVSQPAAPTGPRLEGEAEADAADAGRRRQR